MGPKKTWGGRRAETAGRGRGSRRLGREIRTEADIIGDQQDSDDDSDGEGEGGDDDSSRMSVAFHSFA